MRAAAILPWIPVFPLIGFLVNGLLYLVSHSKLGDKNSPFGPHGHGDGSGVAPDVGQRLGHDAVRGPVHRFVRDGQ